MHYIVHCLDKPDGLPLREANYDAHKAYLGGGPIKILVSGPLLADDETTMIGSLFLVEAASHGEVLAFHRNDPFFAAGVWEHVNIHAFNKRMDNRSQDGDAS